MSASLVVAEEVLDAVASVGSSPVFGRIRRSEELIQVLAADPRSGLDRIGVAERVNDQAGLVFEHRGALIRLCFVSDAPSPSTIEVVALAGIESRRIGTDGLGRMRVLLVGAGSVGSLVGMLLAEAGVGAFTVVDNDRLDAGNLSRHVLDLADIGRPKAAAVAEALRRRLASARSLDVDLTSLSDDDLDDLTAACDLVIATTDSPAAQHLANEACVRTGRTGLFVGAYELAAGGEIISVRPGHLGCYFCAVGFRLAALPTLSTKERRLAYQSADATQRMEAEPGLGADIAYLASVAAAHALALLDPVGSRGALLQSAKFLLLHGGSVPRGSLAELFRSPFEMVRARIRRTDPCPVCGYVTPGGE